jgi:hypothetical protein
VIKIISDNNQVAQAIQGEEEMLNVIWMSAFHSSDKVV